MPADSKAAASSAQRQSPRGYLLRRRGKEAVYIAGADIDQARAILGVVLPVTVPESEKPSARPESRYRSAIR
jgi:hypothetical protein